MSPTTANDDDVRSLQRRAEHAIRAAKPRDYIVRLLEQLIAAAADGTEASRFGHRHLAELRLEESPWRAALHLRRVLSHDPDDDIALALMGLCQALQSNFRSAVAAYRRAVALSPSNPWYNHNLGHLLDVALGASRDALPYLRRAYRLEPGQHEVTASLAHCLGRLGVQQEALELARRLVQKHPHDADHRSLLQWIEQGAPAARDATVPGLLSAISPAAAAARPSASPMQSGDDEAADGGDARELRDNTAPGPDPVDQLLTRAFSREGRPGADLSRARSLWRDYARAARPVLNRPEVAAAAVEYALGRVDGVASKQKDVAARHGVSVSSLQNRYAAIRSVLRLRPRDPRYATPSVPRDQN